MVALERLLEPLLRLMRDHHWPAVAAELAIIAAFYTVILHLLRGTRGARLFDGVGVLVVSVFVLLNFFAEPLGLDRLRFLFERFAVLVVLAVVVVFQPELRRAFLLLGQVRSRAGESAEYIEELVQAANACSSRRYGAIIALERNDPIPCGKDNGVELHAKVTQELLVSVFFPRSPLHDMGVVIRDGKLAYARVQFEQADADEVEGELGSRHRAAVGLTKGCDALVVVVSEETGVISLAEGGRLRRPLRWEELRDLLRAKLDVGGKKGGVGPVRPSGKTITAKPGATKPALTSSRVGPGLTRLPAVSKTLPPRSGPGVSQTGKGPGGGGAS